MNLPPICSIPLKDMLNPRAGFRDPVIPALLAFGQWLVLLTLPLNLRAVSLLFEPSFELPGGVAPIRIDVSAGIGWIEHRLEVTGASATRGLPVGRRCRLIDDLLFPCG